MKIKFMAMKIQALALIFALSLLPLGAHAALRCTVTSSNTTAATSATLALTGCSGLTAGDVIILVFDIDKSSAAPTITGSTFSAITGAADINVAESDGTTSMGVRSRIADGTESTITVTTSGSHFYALTARAYSGRSATPFAVTPAATGPVALGGGTPQAISLTGVTANTGDDIVIAVGGNQAAGTTDVYTLTPPSGYGNTVNAQAASTANAPQQGSADKLSVTAGATGTLSASLANVDTEGIAYAGYVISLGITSSGAALAGAASDTTSATGLLTASSAAFAPIVLDNSSHVGGSDQLNLGSGPNTGTGDSIEVAATKLKQWAQDLNTMAAQLFPNRSLQTPVTGFTIAAAVGVTQLILNPAGTLATGTVTLPISPGDQQPFQLMSSQTVTTLTMNTSDGSTINGAPSTISANTSVKFRFVLSLDKWFRE